MTEDEAESLGFKCSSGYDATRSAFTYRKDVKELLQNGDFIRDYDMKASFPAAFLETHPSLLWVGRWRCRACLAVWRKASPTGRWGLEKAASGSGAMAGVTTLPGRCGCTGRRSGPAWGWTLRGFTELARRLALSGREGQALRDAACYVLNSESERRHSSSDIRHPRKSTSRRPSATALPTSHIALRPSFCRLWPTRPD